MIENYNNLDFYELIKKILQVIFLPTVEVIKLAPGRPSTSLHFNGLHTQHTREHFQYIQHCITRENLLCDNILYT